MSTKAGFLGFVLGGLVGAGLGLLYAPRSGDETRQILLEDTQRISDQALSTIRETQDKALALIKESQARLEALNKETAMRLTKLQEIAKTTLEEQKESLEKGYSGIREVLID